MSAVDPRVRLLTIILTTSMALVFTDPFWMAGLCIFSVICTMLLGADICGFFKRFARFAKLLLTLALLQLIFVREGAPLWSVRGLVLVTNMGFERAIMTAMRYFVILSSAAVMMVENERRITQALVQMKVPYVFAFMMSVALRFLPQFTQAFSDALIAIQLRGVELKKVKWGKRISLYGYLLLPVVADAIIKSQDLAIAMEARGFGAYKNRTSYLHLKLKTSDYIIMGTLLAIGSIAFVRYTVI